MILQLTGPYDSSYITTIRKVLLAALACLALLAGCQPAPQLLKGSDVEVAAPMGYYYFCERNPADPLCGKRP